jgi:hypothetical protein
MVHPLVLCALESYLRRPLEGSWLDRTLMLPAKQTYLAFYARGKHKQD